MTRPRCRPLRTWLPLAALWLAGGWSAAATAPDVDRIAEDAPPPLVIQNPFVAQSAATPAAEPEADTVDVEAVEPEAVDVKPPTRGAAAPMFRLPAVQPAETQTPPSRDDSPSEAGKPPAATATDERSEPTADVLDVLNDMEQLWSEGFDFTPEPSAPPATSTPPMSAPGEVRATPYAPTVEELSRQLLPAVQKAYGLSRHGAIYAAQTEFIQVLRRIAQAKDAASGVDDHARALAAGLRALDEADDFMPRGVELEGELNVAVMASSHRTPISRDASLRLRPDEAIALYHQFAREQLARAVAGEQAGSMALYGLGKVQNRLAYEREGELRHERRALTMFLAALDAGPSNHLAANEIGVLVARGGQPAEAAAMFRRAIDVAPTSTAYHNLAVVERKLGQFEQAAANQRYAQYLAAQDRAAGMAGRRSDVQWVAPQDLSRVAQPLPLEAGDRVTRAPMRPLPPPTPLGPMQPVAKWPQRLIPGAFRR